MFILYLNSDTIGPFLMNTTEPIVFLKGEFVPASTAKINVYDCGVVLGATLTEMTRTFQHRPFRLDDHLARLYRSCKYAGIEIPHTLSEMGDRTTELIEHNRELIGDSQDLGIVHFVTAGEFEAYAGSAASGGPMVPTVCIHSFPLPLHLWSGLFEQGAHLVTPSIRHIPPQCLDPKMKNRSRLHWWMADQQTHAVDPRAITLLLDLDGNVTETGGSNFVMLSGNTVYTPTSRNVLPGVSLLTVRELASQLGYDFVEKDLQPYDVVNADEAWLPTTPYCLAPATRINGTPIGSGKPGPGFFRMMKAWSDRVGMNILGQIRRCAR